MRFKTFLTEMRDDFKYSPSFSIDDFQVTEVESNRFKITTSKPKHEFVKDAFKRLAKIADATKSTNWTNGNGKKVSWWSFSGSEIILTWPKEMLMKKLAVAVDGAQKSEKAAKSKEHTVTKNKEEPKDRNKVNYQDQKDRKQKLYDEYGKDVVDSVKIKPMLSDGDDGNHWAVLVNNHIVYRGLSRREADGEQYAQWDKLVRQKQHLAFLQSIVDKSEDVGFSVPELLKLYKKGDMKTVLNLLQKIKDKGVTHPEFDAIVKSIKAIK